MKSSKVDWFVPIIFLPFAILNIVALVIHRGVYEDASFWLYSLLNSGQLYHSVQHLRFVEVLHQLPALIALKAFKYGLEPATYTRLFELGWMLPILIGFWITDFIARRLDLGEQRRFFAAGYVLSQSLVIGFTTSFVASMAAFFWPALALAVGAAKTPKWIAANFLLIIGLAYSYEASVLLLFLLGAVWLRHFLREKNPRYLVQLIPIAVTSLHLIIYLMEPAVGSIDEILRYPIAGLPVWLFSFCFFLVCVLPAVRWLEEKPRSPLSKLSVYALLIMTFWIGFEPQLKWFSPDLFGSFIPKKSENLYLNFVYAKLPRTAVTPVLLLLAIVFRSTRPRLLSNATILLIGLSVSGFFFSSQIGFLIRETFKARLLLLPACLLLAIPILDARIRSHLSRRTLWVLMAIAIAALSTNEYKIDRKWLEHHRIMVSYLEAPGCHVLSERLGYEMNSAGLSSYFFPFLSLLAVNAWAPKSIIFHPDRNDPSNNPCTLKSHRFHNRDFPAIGYDTYEGNDTSYLLITPVPPNRFDLSAFLGNRN